MRTKRLVCLMVMVAIQGCGSSGSGNSTSGNGATGSNAPATSGAGAAPAAAGNAGSASNASGAGGQSASNPSSNGNPANNGAGGAGQPPATPNNPAMQPQPPTPGSKIAMDECGLHTKWRGDEYCILPPPKDKGFQIHIGPSNYDNPEAMYVMQPGTETNEVFSAVSGNDASVYYYFRQYRMRPGSHHLIVSSGGVGGKRLGGTTNQAKDNPEGGIIAPENQGVGMQLAAKAPLSMSLHYINTTDKPLIKEVWVNFWYRDASLVKEPANEIFSMAPMNVAPGQHVLLSGSCPISQAGRILSLYGHRHANNLRFAAWRVRSGKRDLVLDDYNWDDPLVAEYSSVVQNSAPNPMTMTQGAWSGTLDVQSGDTLDFTCEIVNMTNNTFVGKNEAKNDEMCILVGDAAGTSVPAFCTYSTKQL